MNGIETMEAIGLLRSGATPEVAWWEAFGAVTCPDGAPELPASDAETAAALRSAGRLAHRSGASLADVLSTIEQSERARCRAEAARDVALAGPRSSARVLAWLPAVGWVFALVVDPSAGRVLVGTVLGWGLLAMGGTLWWTGLRWLRRLVRKAEAAGGEGPRKARTLALLEAAVSSGLDVRKALGEVGHALGVGGRGLEVAAERLGEGESWARAWEGVGFPEVERALRSSWFRGASPVEILRATREAMVETGRDEAEREAGRLQVTATLPLALCLLPAFVVLGIVPLMVAVAKGVGG